MNVLQTSIDELRTEFEEKGNRFDARLTSIERTCAIVRTSCFILSVLVLTASFEIQKSHNMSVADGQNINFKRVPFADGSDPVVQVW